MPFGRYKPIKYMTDRHRRRLRVNARITVPSNSNGNVGESSDEIYDSIESLKSDDVVTNSVEVDLNYTDLEFQNVTEDSVEEFSPDSESDELASSEGEDDTSFNLGAFRLSLTDWAQGVTASKVSALLKILKTHPDFKALPSDARSLLKTPRNTAVSVVDGGVYCHIGILKNLLQLLNTYPHLSSTTKIQLQCNVDGVPISRSTSSQLWPILMSLADRDEIPPFVVGVFHGSSKPKNISQFLHDYVTEISFLIENGFEHKGAKYEVEVIAYICDAPARAYLAQLKSHTGYSSCGKCTVYGKNIDNRVVFDEIEAPLRTDESFKDKSDGEHHVGISPLEMVPGSKMVTKFPMEYMHLVCLGVMRKMLFAYLKGEFSARLPHQLIGVLNSNLMKIKESIPVEFARKPRSVNELLRWKATEYRLLLLYTGPYVFKSVLSPSFYKHFLSFHCAIRILVSQNYLSNNLDYAKELLVYFVRNFAILYGTKNLSYNVHGLLHLADDCRTFGPLDSFSAFKFENALHGIKKLIRKHELPLQQIVRRLHEQSLTKTSGIKKLGITYKGVVKSKCILPFELHAPCFNSVEFNKFKITCHPPDNCVVLQNGDIAVVRIIATRGNEKYFVGQKFNKVANYYDIPCTSANLGLSLVSNCSQSLCWSVSNIKNKAIIIPTGKDASGWRVAEFLPHRMYEDRTVLAIPSSWVVRSPRKDLTGNHLEDGIVMYPPESWGKSDVDKAFSLERQPNPGWDELLVHYISPVLDNYAYARKLEMEASYCNDSDLETLVMSRLSAKRYRVPLKKKYPNELTSSSENEDAIKIADPPRIPQIKRKTEDDDTQSASQPQKGTVMCQVKEIRPGCSPNLESKSKESQSRKYNSIPTFSRHLASSSSQEIRDVESASGSVLSVSNQVDGGFMPCSNCNAYKKDIAKVQVQLDEIVSILKVDVMGIKEQLDSLSVQVAGLKVASSNNGETEDSLMFENEFQFPVCSLQDLKRVEEKLSSSLPFRKYLAKYVQDRASFPLLGNLSGKEQGFACNKAVNGMCAAIMTDDMAVLFNMKGRFGERLSFEENFPQVINVLLVATQSKVDAVNGHPVDMPAIKHSLSEWFRLAKTLTGVGKEKRREKARQKKGLPTQ